MADQETYQDWPETPELTDTMQSFVEEVRFFLRDYPDLNRIVDGLEHSDQFIVRAMLMMLDDFAGTPPPLGYFTLDQLVDNYNFRHGCLLGTVAYLLRSLMMLLNRNTLSFNDGGISVALEEARIPLLQTMEAQIRAEWKELVHHKKIAMNMQLAAGYGGMPSEYMALHNWAFAPRR